MNVKFFLFALLVLFSFETCFAGTDLLSCEFKDGQCLDDEQAMLYAHGDYADVEGNVLSSNVALSYNSQTYNKTLCCKIKNNNLNSEFVISRIDSEESCGGKEVMYFTSSSINSVLGFSEIQDFEIGYYSKKLCVDYPDSFSAFNLVLSNDDNYDNLGYQCLFKVNDVVNGKVSSCDAKFNGGSEQYEYSVWAKLIENVNSLQCNVDCTSKLDFRVYSACATKLPSCFDVPEQCDGSIYGGWVNYNQTHQIECSAPWNVFKLSSYTEDKLDIRSSTDTCGSIVTKKYSVLVDNQPVIMNIVMCNS